MIPAYQELAIRIRDAVPDIESTMQRARLAWPQAQCVSEGFNASMAIRRKEAFERDPTRYSYEEEATDG